MLNVALSIVILCFIVNLTECQVALNYDLPQSGYSLQENILPRQSQASLVPISYRKFNRSNGSGINVYSVLSKHPQEHQTALITSKKWQNPREGRRYKIIYKETYKVKQNGSLNTNNAKAANHTVESKYGPDKIHAFKKVSGSGTFNPFIMKNYRNNKNEFIDSGTSLQKFLSNSEKDHKNNYYSTERDDISKEGHNKDKLITIVKSINNPHKNVTHHFAVKKYNDLMNLGNTVNNPFNNINANKNLFNQVQNLQDASGRNETFQYVKTQGNTISSREQSEIQNDVDDKLKSETHNVDNKQSLYNHNVDVQSSEYETVTANGSDGNSESNVEYLNKIKVLSLTGVGNYSVLNDNSKQFVKNYNKESTERNSDYATELLEKLKALVAESNNSSYPKYTLYFLRSDDYHNKNESSKRDKGELANFTPDTVSNNNYIINNKTINLERQIMNHSLSAVIVDLFNSNSHYNDTIHESKAKVTEDHGKFLSKVPKQISVLNLLQTFDNVAHNGQKDQTIVVNKHVNTQTLNTKYLNENSNLLKQTAQYMNENSKIVVDHKKIQNKNYNNVTFSNFDKESKTHEPAKEVFIFKNTESIVEKTPEWFRKYFSTICQDIEQNLSECFFTLSSMTHLNPNNLVNEKVLLIFKLFLKLNASEQLGNLDYVLRTLTCNKNDDDLLSKYRRQLKPKIVTVLNIETSSDKQIVAPNLANSEIIVTTDTRNKVIDKLNVKTHTFRPTWKTKNYYRDKITPNNRRTSNHNSDIFYDNVNQYDVKPNRHTVGEDYNIQHEVYLQPTPRNILVITPVYFRNNFKGLDNTVLNDTQIDLGENNDNFDDMSSERVNLTRYVYDSNIVNKSSDQEEKIYSNKLDLKQSDVNQPELSLHKNIHFPVGNKMFRQSMLNISNNNNDSNYLMTKDIRKLKLGSNTRKEKSYHIHFPVDKAIISVPEIDTRREINDSLNIYNTEDDIFTTKLLNKNNRKKIRNEEGLPDTIPNVGIIPEYSEYLKDTHRRVQEKKQPVLYEEVNSKGSVYDKISYKLLNSPSTEKTENKEYWKKLHITNSLKNAGNNNNINMLRVIKPLNTQLQPEFIRSVKTNAIPFNVENILSDSVTVRVNNLILKTILELRRVKLLDVQLDKIIDIIENIFLPSVINDVNVCQENVYLRFVQKLQNLVTSYTLKTEEKRSL